ncbi:hypothetical protein FGB62_216g021 [Gracilaria domingensis]|nr:hypothetical protein FGB62_216g021 [Gracilaria domingensis]
MLRPRSEDAIQGEDLQSGTVEAEAASAKVVEPEQGKESIHVISSSDEEIVEVHRTKNKGKKRKKNVLDLNVTSIDMTDYTQRAVTIDIKHIKAPEQSLRGMSESHKAELIKNFRKRSLLGGFGLMSVTVARETDMNNALNDEKRVLVNCVLVDGHHRLMALLHVLEHENDPR